jgi:lysylphosphatidylglycerol synthetase-like protein (DUF2156 family)
LTTSAAAITLQVARQPIRDWPARAEHAEGFMISPELTWGIPTTLFLQIHVVLSLIGIAAGLVAAVAMARGRYLPVWTAVFLVTTILTGVTGFPLPPFGLDPPRIIGILLLVLLAVAVIALYGLRLAGPARPLYVVCATASLWLNCFVAVVQSFQKIGPVRALAPTQSEPPFLVAQAITLLIVVALGVLAWRRFGRPATTFATV